MIIQHHDDGLQILRSQQTIHIMIERQITNQRCDSDTLFTRFSRHAKQCRDISIDAAGAAVSDDLQRLAVLA